MDRFSSNASNSVFVRAVDGVSFVVPRHGTVGLAGESGSGKTQTALSIMGLLDGVPGIINGTINIDGTNVLDRLGAYCMVGEDEYGLVVKKDVGRWRDVHEKRLASVRGDKVAMVFQEPRSSLSPYFSVAEHFYETIAARNKDMRKQDYKARALELLNELQFHEPERILERYSYELSGGESQRIMLGLAMVGRPQLLIADEPTTQLDALTQEQVLEVFANLVKTSQVALLLITHNLAVLRLLVEQVAIMFAGKIVEWGPTASVITPDSERSHPYTQTLLRAVADTSVELYQPSDEPIFLDTRVNYGGCRYYHRCPVVKDKDKLTARERVRCEHEEPPLNPVDETHTHKVACWYAQKHYEYANKGTGGQ